MNNTATFSASPVMMTWQESKALVSLNLIQRLRRWDPQSADTVTIGEALEATALSLGDKPVDHKDAAAIQAAETRATGESKARPGGLAVAAQAAASTNEQSVSGEDKVTIADILTVMTFL